MHDKFTETRKPSPQNRRALDSGRERTGHKTEVNQFSTAVTYGWWSSSSECKLWVLI